MTTKVVKIKPVLNSIDKVIVPKSHKKTLSGSEFQKPTPLDFDKFIPWVCLEWQADQVIVINKKFQVEYISSDKKSTSIRSKSRNTRPRLDEMESETSTRKSLASAAISYSLNTDTENALVLNSYYDNCDHLVEIAIIGYQYKIHRKVIQAISLCVPFHQHLNKLTVRKGGLTQSILHEMSKLLQRSHITEVCLDDTNIPEGNYYVLLNEVSNLKCLSLARCRINDLVCEQISRRITFGYPAAKTLMVLDLSTNFITDESAVRFGDVLRTNRRLIHLNLLGNKLTDVGVLHLMRHLKEFPLTANEIFESHIRRLKYLENRGVVYEKCLKEIDLRRQMAEELGSKLNISTCSNVLRRSKKYSIKLLHKERSCANIAEIMTTEVVGDFKDPFDSGNIFYKEGYTYSIGNFTLCFLNLAYNNLEFQTVRMIHDVLKYQAEFVKPPNCTGLLRLELDGNNIPIYCVELERINFYLKKALNDRCSVTHS